MARLPSHYVSLKKRFRNVFRTVENLGKSTRVAGPIDKKTSHLIQLASAVAIRSEGAVHSHTRRAIEAGAKPEEIYHAVILLISTVGFPAVAAALSWVDDILEKK